MRALLVVPTFNEAGNLAELHARTRAALDDLDVLVVDDASPDGTGALADRLARDDPRVRALHRPGKAGLASAYRAGFSWGLAEGYEAFVEMDADLSHDPADLPRLLAALRGADVVIGSRYIPGGRIEDWPRWRRALSRGGNRYVHLLTGLPVADATSGFRAFRRAVLAALDVRGWRSEGYAFQVESALRAWQGGFRLMEVPITFVERRHGASKISRRIVAEAVVRTALWGMAGPRGPGAVHPHSVAARRPAPE